MKICPECGNQNPDDYSFCSECGARLSTAGPIMSPARRPAPAPMMSGIKDDFDFGFDSTPNTPPPFTIPTTTPPATSAIPANPAVAPATPSAPNTPPFPAPANPGQPFLHTGEPQSPLNTGVSPGPSSSRNGGEQVGPGINTATGQRGPTQPGSQFQQPFQPQSTQAPAHGSIQAPTPSGVPGGSSFPSNAQFASTPQTPSTPGIPPGFSPIQPPAVPSPVNSSALSNPPLPTNKPDTPSQVQNKDDAKVKKSGKKEKRKERKAKEDSPAPVKEKKGGGNSNEQPGLRCDECLGDTHGYSVNRLGFTACRQSSKGH